MEELFTKENRRNLSGEPFESRKETLWDRNPSWVMAVKNGCAYLGKAGQLSTLAAIDNAMQKDILFTGLKKTVDCMNSFEYELLERL